LDDTLLAKVLNIELTKENKTITLLDYITKGYNNKLESHNLTFANNLLTKSQEHETGITKYSNRNQRKEQFLWKTGKDTILKQINSIKDNNNPDYSNNSNILDLIHRIVDRYFLNFMSMEYRGFFLYVLIILANSKLNNDTIKLSVSGEYSDIKDYTINNLITSVDDTVKKLIDLFFKVEINSKNAVLNLIPDKEFTIHRIGLKPKKDSNTYLKSEDVNTRFIYNQINEFIKSLNNSFNTINSQEFDKLVFYKASNMQQNGGKNSKRKTKLNKLLRKQRKSKATKRK
jgi:hypothetical protein